jgi:hypothetical protein
MGPRFGDGSVELQYRTALVVMRKSGKIELACRLGITQDAGFKRFNIWPEATSLGRTTCREAIAE